MADPQHLSGLDDLREALFTNIAQLENSSGQRFECIEGTYRMCRADGRPRAVIIAPEPLTEDRSDWPPVPDNYVVVVTPEPHLRMAPTGWSRQFPGPRKRASAGRAIRLALQGPCV